MRADPVLLLIRPEAQSRRLLARVAGALGATPRAIISPVLRIETRPLSLDTAAYGGLIATSQNAIVGVPGLQGRQIHCVGARTREAVARAGARPGICAPRARDLVARIVEARPPGPLLWLRGRHVTRDLAHDLRAGGIATDSAVVYEQHALAPSAELRAALAGTGHAVLPLYSPRSARLLGEKAGKIGRGVHAIALSEAVAQAWREATGTGAETCRRPDGGEMLARIVAGLRRGDA